MRFLSYAVNEVEYIIKKILICLSLKTHLSIFKNGRIRAFIIIIIICIYLTPLHTNLSIMDCRVPHMKCNRKVLQTGVLK